MAILIYKVVKSDYFPYNNTEGDWEECVLGYFLSESAAQELVKNKHTKIETIPVYESAEEEKLINSRVLDAETQIKRMIKDG